MLTLRCITAHHGSDGIVRATSFSIESPNIQTHREQKLLNRLSSNLTWMKMTRNSFKAKFSVSVPAGDRATYVWNCRPPCLFSHSLFVFLLICADRNVWPIFVINSPTDCVTVTQCYWLERYKSTTNRTSEILALDNVAAPLCGDRSLEFNGATVSVQPVRPADVCTSYVVQHWTLRGEWVNAWVPASPADLRH